MSSSTFSEMSSGPDWSLARPMLAPALEGHLGNQSLEYMQLKCELQHNIQRTDCLQYCIQLQAKASSLSFNVSRFSASKTVLDTVMLGFCFSKGNENQKIRQEMIRCGIYFFKLSSWFHSKNCTDFSILPLVNTVANYFSIMIIVHTSGVKTCLP